MRWDARSVPFRHIVQRSRPSFATVAGTLFAFGSRGLGSQDDSRNLFRARISIDGPCVCR